MNRIPASKLNRYRSDNHSGKRGIENLRGTVHARMHEPPRQTTTGVSADNHPASSDARDSLEADEFIQRTINRLDLGQVPL